MKDSTFRIPTTSGKKTAIVVDPDKPLVQIAELMPQTAPGSPPTVNTGVIKLDFLSRQIEGPGALTDVTEVTISTQNFYTLERFFSEHKFNLKLYDDILIEFIDGDPLRPFILPVVLERRKEYKESKRCKHCMEHLYKCDCTE